MTPPLKGFKIGLRYVSIFELNAYQTPQASTSPSATVGYEGLRMDAARSLIVNNPQPRIISQTGDDTVEALQELPPLTALDADLHVGMRNLDILALLTGTKKDTIGTSSWIPGQTNKRGYEPYLGVLAYARSNEWPLGVRTWDWAFFPYAQAIWMASGNQETPQDEIFKLVPNYTSLTPWGVALSDATNGALSQQVMWGKSLGIPHMITWLSAGGETDYSFDAAHPAYDVSSIAVFVNETLDSGASTTVAKVTPSVKPSAGDRIEVWYEE